ncbi:unnamed protein product [Meganyctiphanes norvegica]|uniref:Phosphodiesterase n=1 Tax=Meganyctiphanes norvegica TaxID=48144 RepID=A0AAV2PS88_MEGNR
MLPNYPQTQEKKRGEGVELERTPQNGLLVRMLGDVKGSSGVSVESVSSNTASSSNAVGCQPQRAPKSHQHTISQISLSSPALRLPGDMSVGEAEERLLRCAGVMRTPGTYNRFLTLHRRRRRKPPTRLIDKNHRSLLDDLYHGPTQCVLSHVGNWAFNTFALDSVCGGRPVSVLCVYLMHKYGLTQHYKLDTVTVWKCFSLIEEGYHASNPYHNAVHAADVTQAMHCYLQEDKIMEHMTPLEILAAIVAAVCHDLDHPGVNQPFLIATDNHLAALYRNLSVLENHHWRCAMSCLWESGLLNAWEPDEVTKLQDMIRSLILATDITRQHEFITRFKWYLEEEDRLDMQLAECRHFSLQIALKCADICNPCRPWDISRKWSQKICDEFYRQGDYERQLSLPVTQTCDRYIMTVAKIQAGFIKFVVTPLFDEWNRWLRTKLSEKMCLNMKGNLQQWEKQLEIEAQELAKERETSTSLSVKEDEEDDDDDAITSTSSGDSHQSVLGSLENVSRSLQLGRRHSVPLNLPCMLPRTIIRHESISSEGSASGTQQPLVVETLMCGGLSLTSLSTYTSESHLTTDSLLPDPSITTMTGSSNERTFRPSHNRLVRRMSLPPLYHNRRVGSVSGAGVGTMFSPIMSPAMTPPTNSRVASPTQDPETSASPTSPPSPPSGSKHTTTGCCAVGGEGREGSALNTVGCVGNTHTGDSATTVVETCDRNCSDVADSGSSSHRGCCGYDGGGGMTYGATTTFLQDSQNNPCGLGVYDKIIQKRELSVQKDISDLERDVSFVGKEASFIQKDFQSGGIRTRNLRGNKALVRRASLDSASFNSKRDILERLSQDGTKFAHVDKENLAPISVSGRAAGMGWKTRAWRSYTIDDENTVTEPKEKYIKPGMYKLQSSQGQMWARRGSAPVLRPDELWGGLRGGNLNAQKPPDQSYLATRRASAPSQQLQHMKLGVGGILGVTTDVGSTPFKSRTRPMPPRPFNRTNSLSVLEPFIASMTGCDPVDGDVNYSPLTSTENLPFLESPSALSRFRARRGSMPYDLPTTKDKQHDFATDMTNLKLLSGCGGTEGLSSLVARSVSSSGGGAWGALPSLQSHSHQEFRRGSGGLELLAGFWRSHLEASGSLGSQMEDSDTYSSSGVITPGGSVGHAAVGMPGFHGPLQTPTPHSKIPTSQTLPTRRRGSLPTDFFYSGDLSVWEAS